MTAKHFLKINIFLLLYLIGITRLYAYNESQFNKTYSLPINEIEQVVTEWFHRSGQEVKHVPLEMGQIRLNIKYDKISCQIDLKPNSPLATDIKVDCVINGIPDNAIPEKLWTYIDGYVKGPSFSERSSNQNIPIPVLEHIESVVCIKAVSGNKNIQFSGFIVDKKGLIVCTAHDLKGLEEVTVVIYDGSVQNGRILKTDPDRDLSIVKIVSESDTFISLGKGRNLLGIGEKVFTVGCPIDLSSTIYSGMINSPPRKVNDQVLWQVNMEIHPGSSGSPVFDIEGNIVAVVKGRYRGTQSVGFLIPYETIIEFLNET